jgi:phosphoglycolate phosphatase
LFRFEGATNLQKLLLFDFDYTLADSSKGIIECVNYALQEMGIKTASSEEICKTIGLTLDDAFIKLSGQPQNEVQINKFKASFKKRADEVMVDLTFLYDAVGETLKILKNNGNLLGIVSTKFRYRIETILKRDGVLDLFDIIIGGEDVVSHKPDPEGVFKAVAKLNISLSHCILIGDSVTDAETAKNANIMFIASLTGTTSKDDFRNYRVKHFINDIAELSEYLGK